MQLTLIKDKDVCRAVGLSASPYYILLHKSFKMNNNLQFLLRHHLYRVSAKHAGIIKKQHQLADVYKVFYPLPLSAGACIWPKPFPPSADVLYGRPLCRNCSHKKILTENVQFMSFPFNYIINNHTKDLCGAYDLIIHSFIHSGDLYSASSRDYYSEALPAQPRTKKKDLREM